MSKSASITMYVPCTDWSGNETDLLLLNCKLASLKAFFDTAVGPEDAFDMSPIRMEELTIQLLGCLLSPVTVFFIYNMTMFSFGYIKYLVEKNFIKHHFAV